MFRAFFALLVFAAAVASSGPAFASRDIGLCPSVLKALDPEGDEEFSGSNDAAMAAAQSCSAQDKGLSLLSEAYVLRRMDRNSDARAKIDESLAIGGDPVAAYRLRCALLTDEKKYDEARAVCRKAIAADGKRALGYFGLGQMEFAAGRWSEALSAYQTASHLSNDEDPNLWSMIGQTYNKMDRWAEGFASLRKAIALNPAYLGAQIELSWALVMRHRPEEALAVTEAAIARHPSSGALHRWRGRAFEQLERYDDAFNEYDATVKFSPKWADAYWERATMHWQAKRRGEAVSDFNQAIALNPSFTGAYYDLGRLWLEEGQDKIANINFSKAINLDPKNANYYAFRADSLLNIDKGAALNDYMQALSLDNKNYRALAGYAMMMYNAGKFEKAVEIFTRALEQDPKSHPALFWRARAYTDMKNLPAAIADYTRLLYLEPENAWAYYNRGELYYGTDNCREAIADFEQAIHRLPGKGSAWTRSALCAVREPDKGKDWLERMDGVWRAAPETADKHKAAMIVALWSREWDQVESSLNRADALDPNDPLLKKIGPVLRKITLLVRDPGMDKDTYYKYLDELDAAGH